MDHIRSLLNRFRTFHLYLYTLHFVPSKENRRAACGELGRTKHALHSSLRYGLRFGLALDGKR